MNLRAGRVGRDAGGLCLLVLFLSLSGLTFLAVPAGAFENWYPSDIRPPSGCQYPCALTALPLALKGVPQTDQRFVNHVYSMILKMVRAKLTMLDSLNRGQQVSGAYARYYRETREALDRIGSEPTPAGLESFKKDVEGAAALQMNFFNKAVAMRTGGRSMQEIYAIPEGKAASGKLISAWSRMSERYPTWSADTKDSIYHHLCALDLF